MSLCYYRKDWLYPIEYGIYLEIKALKELVKDDEKSVSNIQDKLNTMLESAKNKKIEEQYKDLFEEHLYDRQQISQNMIIQKRYSTCVLIFSIFEGILKDTCSKIRKNNQPLFNPFDYKAKDDLTKCKNYLKNIIEIDFSKAEPSFTKLKQQTIIRNRIAHNNGMLKKSENIQYVEGIDIRNKIIKIKGIEYFNYLINEIENFF